MVRSHPGDSPFPSPRLRAIMAVGVPMTQLQTSPETSGHWLSPDDLLSEVGPIAGLAAAVLESDPGFYARSPASIGRLLAADFPPESLDLLILADLLHANSSILPTLKPALKPSGRLVLFDWNPAGPCPPGPPLAARISMHDALCLAERASFTLLRSRQFEAGYLLILEPTDETVQS